MFKVIGEAVQVDWRGASNVQGDMGGVRGVSYVLGDGRG